MLHIQESPYIKEIHYDNADDFIQAISYKGELYEMFNEHFVFRGHSTDKYELQPSALRDYLALSDKHVERAENDEQQLTYTYLATTELVQVYEEYKLLEKFFNTCDRNGLYVPHIETLRNSFYPGVDGETLFMDKKWLPKEYWELAALAQHHGVKTRLLDWTHDLYVALYFASSGVYNDPKEDLNMKDAYAAHVRGEEYPPKRDMEIWALNTNVVLTKPTQVPLKLVQPQYHNNDNLCAQKGMFTFWESIKPEMIHNKEDKDKLIKKTDRRTLDVQLHDYLTSIEAEHKYYLYRITVPQTAAYTIFSHVEKLGYNASTIFPGYDGVVKYLDEQSRIKK